MKTNIRLFLYLILSLGLTKAQPDSISNQQALLQQFIAVKYQLLAAIEAKPADTAKASLALQELEHALREFTRLGTESLQLQEAWAARIQQALTDQTALQQQLTYAVGERQRARAALQELTQEKERLLYANRVLAQKEAMLRELLKSNGITAPAALGH